MIRQLSDDVRCALRSGVALRSVGQCVEELLLNSVDAQATCIAVRVDLQIFRVQVVDNGCGLSWEDMEGVGRRYFTSKCQSLEDLEDLRFCGFRGEAVSSMVEVCSVVEISSRDKATGRTSSKVFQNRKSFPVEAGEVSRPSAGTTVTLHNVFYNLPVRRRQVEAGLELEVIRQKVEAVSLLYPGISFSVKDDALQSVVLTLPRTRDVTSRFCQIHGPLRSQHLRAVLQRRGHLEVSGLISREGHYNKSLQFLYVNRRLVLRTRLHRLLQCLLKKESVICRPKAVPAGGPTCHPGGPTPELHPVFVLNIRCPPHQYDVCLEPDKTLVEFQDWASVLLCVEAGVRDFLDREELHSPPRDAVHLSDPPPEGPCAGVRGTPCHPASLQSKSVCRGKGIWARRIPPTSQMEAGNTSDSSQPHNHPTPHQAGGPDHEHGGQEDQGVTVGCSNHSIDPVLSHHPGQRPLHAESEAGGICPSAPPPPDSVHTGGAVVEVKEVFSSRPPGGPKFTAEPTASQGGPPNLPPEPPLRTRPINLPEGSLDKFRRSYKRKGRTENMAAGGWGMDLPQEPGKVKLHSTLSTKLCQLKRNTEAELPHSTQSSGGLHRPQPESQISPNLPPQWLQKYETSLGRRVFINTQSGLSTYNTPQTETPAPCTRDVSTMPVRVVCEDNGFQYQCYPFRRELLEPYLPRGSTEQGARPPTGSLQTSYSEWRNPVFPRHQELAVDTRKDHSESLAVKIHNILYPYRFTREMILRMKVLQQVDNKFIACLIDTNTEGKAESGGNLLVLVDQHAAHERVRLEQLIADSYEPSPGSSGRKLKVSRVDPPLRLEMTADQIRLLRIRSEALHRAGLTLSFPESRPPQVLVSEIPQCFMEKKVRETQQRRADLAKKMVEEVLQEEVQSPGALGPLPGAVMKVLASQACHGAVKFNDPLSVEECRHLLDCLAQCSLPFQCAHGRPAILPLADLLHLQLQVCPKPDLSRLRRHYKAWRLFGAGSSVCVEQPISTELHGGDTQHPAGP